MTAPYPNGPLRPISAVSSISALRGLPSATFTAGQVAVVYTGALSSSQDFLWDGSETSADDGVNFVQPSDVSGSGRWCAKLQAPRELVLVDTFSDFIPGSADGPSSLRFYIPAEYKRAKQVTLECTFYVGTQHSPPDRANNTAYSVGQWVQNTTVYGDKGLYHCITAGTTANPGPGPTTLGAGPLVDGGAHWASAAYVMALGYWTNYTLSAITNIQTITSYLTLAAGFTNGLDTLKSSVDVTSTFLGFSSPMFLVLYLTRDPADTGTPEYYTQSFVEHARLVFS